MGQRHIGQLLSYRGDFLKIHIFRFDIFWLFSQLICNNGSIDHNYDPWCLAQSITNKMKLSAINYKQEKETFSKVFACFVIFDWFQKISCPQLWSKSLSKLNTGQQNGVTWKDIIFWLQHRFIPRFEDISFLNNSLADTSSLSRSSLRKLHRHWAAKCRSLKRNDWHIFFWLRHWGKYFFIFAFFFGANYLKIGWKRGNVKRHDWQKNFLVRGQCLCLSVLMIALLCPAYFVFY